MKLAQLVQRFNIPATMSNEPLPSNIIDTILELAVWAPNHKHREPWRFISVERDYLKQLVELLTASGHQKTAASIYEAPVVLIVTAVQNNDKHIASDDFAAACCVIQNIRLLGVDNGLVVEWNQENYANHERLHQLIGVTENEKIAGIVAIGKRQESEEQPDSELADDQLVSMVDIQHICW